MHFFSQTIYDFGHIHFISGAIEYYVVPTIDGNF